MSKLIYLCIVAIIPCIVTQCVIEKAKIPLRRAVYTFSSNLAARIAQESDNHFIMSAISPWTLISLASLGAGGNTLEEIQQVLRLHPHKCFKRKFFEIIKALTSTGDGAVFKRSSNIYVDDRLPLKDEFKREIDSSGIGNIIPLVFDDFEYTASVINEQVRSDTNDTIQDIISATELDNIHVVMIDAVYFKGQWKFPFDAADTEVSSFYDERERMIGDVNLMYLMGSFNMESVDLIQAQIIEIPYADENKSMLVFLPFKQIPLSAVIDNLKRVTLATIFATFRLRGPQTVTVQIPRFKISSDVDNLKELLSDMGLKRMFDSNEADFSKLSEYALYVSDFKQKAEVMVTEEGTVAAAVSSVGFASRSYPREFVANRPFLFMILDRVQEIPLFTGAYSKPSLF